jgi:hypothetical protein
MGRPICELVLLSRGRDVRYVFTRCLQDVQLRFDKFGALLIIDRSFYSPSAKLIPPVRLARIFEPPTTATSASLYESLSKN